MNGRELRKHIKCSVCKDPLGRSGMPSFWVLTLERHGIKLDAVRRHDGFAAAVGSPVLAEILGPDEDLTLELTEPVKVTVCERCMLDKFLPLADLGLGE